MSWEDTFQQGQLVKRWSVNWTAIPAGTHKVVDIRSVFGTTAGEQVIVRYYKATLGSATNYRLRWNDTSTQIDYHETSVAASLEFQDQAAIGPIDSDLEFVATGAGSELVAWGYVVKVENLGGANPV